MGDVPAGFGLACHRNGGRHRGQDMVAAAEARAARAARDLRSIKQAAERHAEWLRNRASTSIPDVWHAEAQRLADRAAAAQAEMLAELRRELAKEKSARQ